MAQVSIMLMMALTLGLGRDMQISDARDIISEIERLGTDINSVLHKKEEIKALAEKYAKYEHMFVLGRNFFYPVAGEASLKCKELSYIHCESYSA